MDGHDFESGGELWQYEGAGGWHFVTIPDELVEEVRELSEGSRKPFGSSPVEATIGSSIWTTSIFADRKRDSFLLPVKAGVRDAENLLAGDQVQVKLTLA